MRGPSKESRFAQPLTAIALVIDDRGMVLDYTVFPGNLSEFKTLEPAIKKLQDKYRVKNSYVVADRGLNSVLNLKMLKQQELGFIVAQKVSYQGKKLREKMLSDEGWHTPDDTTSTDSASFRYKVCDYVKTARVKQDDGKEKLIKQPCKIIFTYSEKRYKKDIYELYNAIARAQKALNERKLLKTSFGSGGRSLVATKAETVSGEEIMETFHLPPCKAVGEIKNAIKEAILEGTINNNPEEARAYMFKIASNMPGIPSGQKG